MGMLALALGAYFIYSRTSAAATTTGTAVATAPIPTAQANPLAGVVSPITNLLGTLFNSMGGTGSTAQPGTSGVASPVQAQQGLSTLQDLGQTVISNVSDGTSGQQTGGVNPFSFGS